MTEQELQVYLKNNYPKENEGNEWKDYSNLKHTVKGHEGDDIISYLSAIANMEGGCLVLGVEDGSLNIMGIREMHVYTAENVKIKFLDNCVNLPSEGLWVEEHVTDDSKKVVWVLHVPKHRAKLPVYAHNKAWQRAGESLIPARPERIEAILNEVQMVDDWSAKVIPDATIDDLDPKAIEVARENYANKHEHLREELKGWSDIEFLNRAKVTRSGQITNAAIILLGKPESEVLISPAVSKLRWIVKDSMGVELDYEICSCPMILAVDKVYGHIRNLKYRMINPALQSLFPDEMDTYEPYVIREAMNNAIAHQDYSRGGMVNVVEFEDRLVFTNLGSFIPGTIKRVLESDAPEENYHNKFLAQAMVELKMVDTIGSGIRRMFGYQKRRLFPMPDYEFSDNRVKLTIFGKVLDLKYANQLAKNVELTLVEIEMLNRVQLGKELTNEEVAYLRRRGLIEGRKGALVVSKLLAQKTGQMASYTLAKGFDDQYYRDLIIKALKQHGKLSRKDINALLMKKLPDALDEKQKVTKVGHLLGQLRGADKIRVGAGKLWELV